MLLDALLIAAEKSALGVAIRDLGTWSYALINLVHIFSIAAVFGAMLILDLCLLGWRRHINLADLSATTLPIAVTGFVGAVISGVCMLSVNASEYIGNPFLVIKFGALLLALINAAIIRFIPAWKFRAVHEPQGRAKLVLACFGLVSLLCWITVVSAGRMIAYW